MSEEILLNPPTEEQIPKILIAIKEDSKDRLDQNVKLFEEWIKCQSYLPKNYEKQALISYIRGSKHDLETAKRKYTMMAMGKRNIPQIFENRRLAGTELLKSWGNICAVPLPKLTKRGERVVLIQLKNADPNNFDTIVLQKITWMIADYRIHNDKLTAGDIFVFDVHNYTAGHCSKLLTVLIKETIKLWQDALPFRLAGIHIVNANAYLDAFARTVMLLFKEKIKKRFHINQGIDCLKESVGTEVLPFEYGGDQEKLEVLEGRWKEEFLKNEDTLERWANLKCTGDVPKEITEKYKFEEDNFGIQGSFRQINLD